MANEMATRAFEEAHKTFHDVMDRLIGDYPASREEDYPIQREATSNIRDAPESNIM